MVGAVVVAAGQSNRMGRFKLLLPWWDTTVIGQVVATLGDANISEIVVVSGHRAPDIHQALSDTPARVVFNKRYLDGEMLDSVQVGLASLSLGCEAALFCLGDQPQMEKDTIQAILADGEKSRWQQIIVPSYHYRAGHPVLLPRTVWPAIQSASGTLRQVIAMHRERVRYVSLETASILMDLDTPGDYHDALGRSGSKE